MRCDAVQALFDRVLAGLSDDLRESRAAVAMGNMCDGELEYAKARPASIRAAYTISIACDAMRCDAM